MQQCSCMLTTTTFPHTITDSLAGQMRCPNQRSYCMHSRHARDAYQPTALLEPWDVTASEHDQAHRSLERERDRCAPTPPHGHTSLSAYGTETKTTQQNGCGVEPLCRQRKGQANSNAVLREGRETIVVFTIMPSAQCACGGDSDLTRQRMVYTTHHSLLRDKFCVHSDYAYTLPRPVLPAINAQSFDPWGSVFKYGRADYSGIPRIPNSAQHCSLWSYSM